MGKPQHLAEPKKRERKPLFSKREKQVKSFAHTIQSEPQQTNIYAPKYNNYGGYTFVSEKSMKKRLRRDTWLMLVTSFISLGLCLCMLFSTTYAWYTAVSESNAQTIQSGNIDYNFNYRTDSGAWANVGNGDVFDTSVFNCGEWKYSVIKIENTGTIDFSYDIKLLLTQNKLGKNLDGDELNLAEKVDVVVATISADDSQAEIEEALENSVKAKALSDCDINNYSGGALVSDYFSKDNPSDVNPRYYAVALYVKESTDLSSDEDFVPAVTVKLALRATQYISGGNTIIPWDGESYEITEPDSNNAYHISSGEQLAWIIRELQDPASTAITSNTVSVVLTKDINMNGKDFIIGNTARNVDIIGNDHVIYNLHMVRYDSDVSADNPVLILGDNVNTSGDITYVGATLN